LINCEFCNRTFLPERLGIHRKICTAEKPFKPLPPKNARGDKAAPPTNNSNPSAGISKGMASRGGGNSGYGGGGEEKPLGKKPMGGGYKANPYEEEEEYTSPKPTQKKAAPGGKPSYSAKPQVEDDEEEEVYKPSKPTQSKPMGMARNQGYSASNNVN